MNARERQLVALCCARSPLAAHWPIATHRSAQYFLGLGRLRAHFIADRYRAFNDVIGQRTETLHLHRHLIAWLHAAADRRCARENHVAGYECDQASMSATR